MKKKMSRTITAVAGALLAAAAAAVIAVGGPEGSTSNVADPNWGLVVPTPTATDSPAPDAEVALDPNWG
ncbi:hypothetical protein O1L60_45395 [Streptomyces diastatochromogenes]|nr:hypothetical protein [Streptomyces diastatochromogenes]